MRVLYGPIHSWRFGRSLGIDLLAGKGKRCPLNCLYCQYGETVYPTWQRRVWTPVGRLRGDLAALGRIEADGVTFAGLGEPTLAANLVECVAAVREVWAGPVRILTGGALLPDLGVRGDLLAFDEVVIKLDAPDEALFRQINRPVSGFPYRLADVVSGIVRLREAYRGRLVLQMMWVQANRCATAEMAALARRLGPDQVQLDTPLQPALGGPLNEAEMADVVRAFEGLPVRHIYEQGAAAIRPRTM